MKLHPTTAPAGPRPTRAGLAAAGRRRLSEGRNRTKAVVDLVEHEGALCALKDVASRPWWVRTLLGPWQLRREVRAYRRLAGVPGVPRLVAIVDRRAILIEYVEGRPLGQVRRGELDDSFFDRLEALVRAAHRRGVAHGDLHRGDVLVSGDGQPHLVDFSTSFQADPSGRGPRRLIYEQMCRADLRSVAKLRRRLGPGPAPPDPPRPPLYRIVRAIRDRLTRRGAPPRGFTARREVC